MTSYSGLAMTYSAPFHFIENGGADMSKTLDTIMQELRDNNKDTVEQLSDAGLTFDEIESRLIANVWPCVNAVRNADSFI